MTNFIMVSIVAAAIIGAVLWLTGWGYDAASVVAAQTGIPLVHDKLGWLDDSPLTDADRQRIAEITGNPYSDNLGVIRAIQSGARGNLTRRDFELLRQDRRRAQAAYPDVDKEKLFVSGWFNVDMSARVPSDFCNSGNSNGTQGADGKWYLDGGCYLSYVSADYPKRTDAATTKRVLAELKDATRQKRLAHIKHWGYSTWSSGTGGSLSVNCYPDPLPSSEEADEKHIAGQCVIILDEKTQYTFPFEATDWLDPPWSHADLAKFAESKGAQAVSYLKPAPKPWTIKDGLMSRGQTGAPGRLYWSHFNWDKDDYDNEDIGPDTPESWVLEQPFGIAYLPAPGNGERRSVPGKPWYLVASYYGFAPQVSGGWDENECKAQMPKLQTGHTWSMVGESEESSNRGNLREARCTQVPPMQGAMVLADRALPVKPIIQQQQANRCVQGGTLMPGQSCVFP
jgi:hypothetical protein